MPQREKVEFPANIPTIVELDGTGTLQASKNGDDEYRYFLENGKIMWVPPTVHEMIEAHLDAIGSDGNGDALEITKAQAKRGAAIQWNVRPANITPAERHRRNNQGYSNSPSPTQPPPVSQPRTQREMTRQAAPPIAPPQPAAQMELPTTSADRMAACMADAIELWRGASTMEPGLQWGAADVRALAATLFIEGGKR